MEAFKYCPGTVDDYAVGFLNGAQHLMARGKAPTKQLCFLRYQYQAANPALTGRIDQAALLWARGLHQDARDVLEELIVGQLRYSVIERTNIGVPLDERAVIAMIKERGWCLTC